MKNVKIIIGNIEEQNTQAIVNPTNAELAWEDLTCNGAIMNKAGPCFIEACQEFIDKNGKLEMNDIYMSYGFNTNAEFILNVYPPFWQPAISVEENILNLSNCYEKCLQRYVDMGGRKSISFPLIGAGTFGYPIEASYKILETVLKDKDFPIDEIRIVFWKKEQYKMCEYLFEL